MIAQTVWRVGSIWMLCRDLCFHRRRFCSSRAFTGERGNAGNRAGEVRHLLGISFGRFHPPRVLNKALLEVFELLDDAKSRLDVQQGLVMIDRIYCEFAIAPGAQHIGAPELRCVRRGHPPS